MADVFWGGGLWFPIGMMIVMLLVAFLVCGRGLRRFRGHAAGGAGCCGSPDAPEDVLKRRYAEGAITREEFERVRRELGGQRA